MQDKELELAGASLHYEIKSEQVTITSVRGQIGEISIPESIDGFPVTRIEKKAFLSNKVLRRISLPESIEAIGDWAFGYCSNLEEVALKNRRAVFERAVFLECGKLKRITVPEQDFCPELLAAAVTSLDAGYLLDLPAVGDREWLEKWDARMLTILDTPDDTGYSKQVLCGEEDYGSTDFNAYTGNSRKKKVRIILLRLLHAKGLKAELRERLESYLREHTKHSPTEEAWQVIHREYGNDREYYSLFAELGCVTPDNLEDILIDIGEEYPEMKAFLLRYRSEAYAENDFFDDLEL